MYKGKKILITGGTGTIGKQLTRRLLKEEPSVIRIFSRDEFKQFEMAQEYQKYTSQLRFLIGDVRDQQRLIRAMEEIDYVFHCAAMKHVPACEYNPFEAVQTNVIGTQNVIQAAIENKVKKVLFTSTDKAISPTNTYGATKLTAERLISAAEFQKGAKSTVFSSVRFGNVMGSRGSVIPLFKKQILEQRKITITDPNMLRYMMTPGQAIELILKANKLAKGGEVFVLKMPLIRMGDLAEVVIEEIKAQYGITEKISIEEIGLRPGEKRFEELMTDDEVSIAYETEEMFVITPQFGKKDENQVFIYKQISTKPSPFEGKVILKKDIVKWVKQNIF
ncbi:UDP-N-acetylglucosamine 4,6-dehydratase family protein [Paenibacillus ihumii]|uniref:UDP-N-acetylglucosamine 4,6-dehydratase family protein n=1 Tax=Paenibacillus ihumii TaxID=687436 RepID=UPI001651C056|nr:UDP-N-acetylglucosamine 4,6-dehydratase family protein [Paenibacillus ihumii]